MKTASWVIVSKDTGKAVFETFEKRTVDAINTDRYAAVPILDYLVNINRIIRDKGEAAV